MVKIPCETVLNWHRTEEPRVKQSVQLLVFISSILILSFLVYGSLVNMLSKNGISFQDSSPEDT